MAYNDNPDWGGLYNNAAVFPLFDLGELAARLGSPVVYDRRGAVLWWEDFSYGLGGVEQNNAGANSAIALSATGFYRGPFCVRMASGSEISAFAAINKALPLPTLSAFGASCLVTLGTGVEEFTFYVEYDDAATISAGYIIVSQLTNKIYIADPTGRVEIAAGAAPSTRLDTHWYFKLVLDPTTRRYVRAVVNDLQVDLSAYALYPVTTDGYRHLNLVVRLANVAGTAGGTCYVDNIIATYAEPTS